jgi:hypothetical protein
VTNVVQEKFQVTYPDYDSENEEDVQSWVPDSNARAKKMMPGREGRAGGDVNSRYGNNVAMFTTLPPGMDIEDQEVTDQRRMGINTSGGYPTRLAAGDRTQDLNPTCLRKGFDKKKLLQTDDAYTREHNDAFYDDVGGFVERNNMLDRL